MSIDAIAAPRAYDRDQRARRILLALSFVALAVRIAFSEMHDHRNDLSVFAGWAIQLRYTAPWEFRSSAGYPPGYFVVLLAVGRLYGLITAHIGDPSGLILRALVKLPPIVMDVVNAWIIYGIARRVAANAALTAAILWLFNPVALITSTFWGQIDSVSWGLALGTILCALWAAHRPAAAARWFACAWLLLVLSLLIKPAAITLLPVLAVYAARGRAGTLRARLFGSACGLVGGGLVTWIICSLFSGDANPFVAARWLYNELFVHSMIGPSGAFTSLNAYNIWSVILPFYLPDTVKLFGVTLATAGNALAAGLIAIVLVRFARLRDGRALVEAAMLASFALFLCATRMHERYVDGSLMFAITLIGLGRQYVAFAIILTITTALDTLYGLRFGELFSTVPPYAQLPGYNLRDFWPAISHPASFANVVLFAAMLLTFLRPSVPRDAVPA